MCLIVLFLVTVKRKTEFFLNFCLRAAMGGIAIYGINLLLESQGLPWLVGINLFSLLTSGTLGLSGVSLLYAISAFRFL
ncbi:MAG: pro-sigmaK processing inhibitor BofA family protein [Lachnospiraceae bacterium]|nr:pro-sigmaK processing inhibitor BofA family protein [Lachnospiraceae bacterium]